MLWQTIIVVAIIALSVGFGAWRLYKTLKHGGCACSPSQVKGKSFADPEAHSPAGGCCGGCAGCKSKAGH